MESLKAGLRSAETGNDQRQIARFSGALGAAERSLGRFQLAVTHLTTAVDIFEKLGDKASAARDLVNLGLAYNDLGDDGQALQCLERARQTADQLGRIKIRAAADNNLGLIYKRQGKYGKALSRFTDALQAYHQLKFLKEQAITIANIGDVFLDTGDLDEAAKWYGKVDSPVRMGRLSLARKHYRRAIDYFNVELQRALKSGRVSTAFAAYVGQGMAHEALGSMAPAVEAYQNAVDMLEAQRRSLLPALRINFYSGKILGFRRLDAYEGLARALYFAGEHERSFQVAESSKARVLAEVLFRRGGGDAFGVPAALLDREDALQVAVARLRKQVRAARSRGDASAVRELTSELAAAQARQVEVVKHLSAHYPSYAACRYPQPMGARDISLRSGEVLLAYQVTDRGVLSYLVRGRKLARVFWTPIPRAQLRRSIRSLRKSLSGVKTIHDLRDFDYRASHKLHRLLLEGPIAATNPTDTLIIVPDGILSLLPFDVLSPSRREGKWACDQRKIVYVHSGTSLTLSRRFSRAGRHTGRNRMFVLADPIFGPEDTRVSGSVKEYDWGENLITMRAITEYTSQGKKRAWFPRLALTGEMAFDLKKHFPNNCNLLTGYSATRKNLQRQPLDTYQYMVFATHGILADQVPYVRQPALVLTQSRGKIPDGFWTLSDVMSRALNCRVAVLTACSTGVGRHVSGEGVMHLGRGFQYAGAQSVIVSLWNVAEESTTRLTELFFSHLKGGEEPAAALWKARRQLRSLENGRYDHPYFWGGFILVGG